MLLGEKLPQPLLRFNYSHTKAVDSLPKRGLYKYGPYDLDLLDKDQLTCALFYPENSEGLKKKLVSGLLEGVERFGGFESLFKLPLTFADEISYSESNVSILLQEVTTRDIDFVYFILEKNRPELYRKAKLTLLMNSIPNQMISTATLEKREEELQYVLENIALATYAKACGSPWTVSTEEKENYLVLGVSRAKDNEGYLVGFVMVFTSDGDFIFMNSKAPVIRWGEYVSEISDLIEESIHEYIVKKGQPDKIVLHLSKRPGRGELEAIENALESAGVDVPYAMLHLNQYSNFRVFDSSHPSYVPPKGLMVRLSSYEAILITHGRTNGWKRVGVPRVLNVRLDKRSTLSSNEFLKLVRQTYYLSYVNWRGFNAETIPATLNYSYLIARLVAELGSKNWSKIAASGRLRDKSWYL